MLGIKKLTAKPTVVLTNATKLTDPEVRTALSKADKVSIKLDAVSNDGLHRINRPIQGLSFPDIWSGILQFKAVFRGELAIQTMILFPWDATDKAEYIRLVKSLAPTEIQLNLPIRPKPLQHQLSARGNHASTNSPPYPVQQLRCISREFLRLFAAELQAAIRITVRYPNL